MLSNLSHVLPMTLAQARAIGIDWLVWHYVYTTEFLYLKLHARESAKTITIFDVDGMCTASLIDVSTRA